MDSGWNNDARRGTGERATTMNNREPTPILMSHCLSGRMWMYQGCVMMRGANTWAGMTTTITVGTREEDGKKVP
jgi:hypothetical protein